MEKVNFTHLIADSSQDVESDQLPALEALDVAEELGEIPIQEIYKQLSIHDDIILIIDKIDEPRIRKALSAIKSKETAKLRSAGVRPEDITLEFMLHPQEDSMTEEQVKLQVFFKRKSVVKVHKLILPTGELA